MQMKCNYHAGESKRYSMVWPKSRRRFCRNGPNKQKKPKKAKKCLYLKWMVTRFSRFPGENDTLAALGRVGRGRFLGLYLLGVERRARAANTAPAAGTGVTLPFRHWAIHLRGGGTVVRLRRKRDLPRRPPSGAPSWGALDRSTRSHRAVLAQVDVCPRALLQLPPRERDMRLSPTGRYKYAAESAARKESPPRRQRRFMRKEAPNSRSQCQNAFQGPRLGLHCRGLCR